MSIITLKLSFADNVDTREFLRFLTYLQYCGNIGHSTGITVNADGDGSFKMQALIEDPHDGQFKNVRDILQIPPNYWNKEIKSYREWKNSQRADRIPEKNIDRNEIAFNLGD